MNHGQWPQQRLVEERKDCGVRADAECQGDDGDETDERSLEQSADGEVEIHDCGCDGVASGIVYFSVRRHAVGAIGRTFAANLAWMPLLSSARPLVADGGADRPQETVAHQALEHWVSPDAFVVPIRGVEDAPFTLFAHPRARL